MDKPHQWDEIQIPLGRVAKFIRQLTHDVRNGLSAIDLEAAFISEIATDPEVSDEVRKLREMVGGSAGMLRVLSSSFQPVALHEIPWEAPIFFKELESRVLATFPGEMGIVFEENFGSGEGKIFIDLEQMIVAVLQIVTNAIQFQQGEGEIRIIGTMEGDGSFQLDIVEPKPEVPSQFPIERWGLEPLRTTRSGGYGLGLWKMRGIVDGHGGQVEIRHRNGQLRTRLCLPEYHEEDRPV